MAPDNSPRRQDFPMILPLSRWAFRAGPIALGRAPCSWSNVANHEIEFQTSEDRLAE